MCIHARTQVDVIEARAASIEELLSVHSSCIAKCESLSLQRLHVITTENLAAEYETFMSLAT